ncbi:MAG: DNA primase [Synergistaceae bacterium]|jgi:DNA primase|nr:DNA primase [Synergistaceae bacterium]
MGSYFVSLFLRYCERVKSVANDDVKRIKDRLDILEVVGDKVRLHRSGRGYMGLCPFHDEKTPSFHVSQEKQNYHCYGCGKGGDVFSFVMEAEGLEFRQALELLAERAGVKLTPLEGVGNKRASGNLHEVMEIAGKSFRALLTAPEGEVARSYLIRRDISLDLASRFELGWSGSSWDHIWRLLQNERVSAQEALDAGLILESQRGGFYDRFRGRVIFPIHDVSGRLIAFGGRVVDGEGAKYINSPEGTLYSKRRNLYLLHVAKNTIREKRRAILVEGYMDALRLHIHGYTESVASLGTSLTEEQAKLLKRFSSRCYICYDSDAAGQEAAIKGMYTLQNYELDVYVISLPKGKDPDELLNSEGGKELFEAALTGARPLVLQHLHTVRALLDDPVARRGGVQSLFEGLSQLHPTIISPYVPQVAAAMGFYPDQFWREWELFRRRSRTGARVPKESDPEKGRVVRKNERTLYDPLEAALCALLWRDEEYRRSSRPEEILSLLADSRVKEIALAILMESPHELETRWHTMNERFPLAFIARGDSFCEELEFARDPDPWRAVCEALKRKRAQERLSYLDERMKRHEATFEEMAEFQRIATQLKSGKRAKTHV